MIRSLLTWQEVLRLLTGKAETGCEESFVTCYVDGQASRSGMPAGSSTALSMVSELFNRLFPAPFRHCACNVFLRKLLGVKLSIPLLAGIQPDGQMPSDKTIGGGDDGKTWALSATCST